MAMKKSIPWWQLYFYKYIPNRAFLKIYSPYYFSISFNTCYSKKLKYKSEKKMDLIRNMWEEKMYASWYLETEFEHLLGLRNESNKWTIKRYWIAGFNNLIQNVSPQTIKVTFSPVFQHLLLHGKIMDILWIQFGFFENTLFFVWDFFFFLLNYFCLGGFGFFGYILGKDFLLIIVILNLGLWSLDSFYEINMSFLVTELFWWT